MLCVADISNGWLLRDLTPGAFSGLDKVLPTHRKITLLINDAKLLECVLKPNRTFKERLSMAEENVLSGGRKSQTGIYENSWCIFIIFLKIFPLFLDPIVFSFQAQPCIAFSLDLGVRWLGIRARTTCFQEGSMPVFRLSKSWKWHLQWSHPNSFPINSNYCAWALPMYEAFSLMEKSKGCFLNGFIQMI